MITKNNLSAAVRAADNLMDTGTKTDEILRLRGLNSSDAFYVAEQRALRLVLAARGELKSVGATAPSKHQLSAEETRMLRHLMVAWLDGLITGTKCGKDAATVTASDGKHRHR